MRRINIIQHVLLVVIWEFWGTTTWSKWAKRLRHPNCPLSSPQTRSFSNVFDLPILTLSVSFTKIDWECVIIMTDWYTYTHTICRWRLIPALPQIYIERCYKGLGLTHLNFRYFSKRNSKTSLFFVPFSKKMFYSFYDST